MGGTMNVASREGTGSTFWFTVPLELGHEEFEAEEAPEPPDLALGGRVLVVEDNDNNRWMVREMLAEREIHCVEAGNGEEAVQAVAGGAGAGGLDLILMDCRMPQMDGFEATRRIRAWEEETGRPTSTRIPIVALTANASSEDRKNCLEAGMDDYLSKPFRMADLFQMLEKWMEMPEEATSFRA
jgi:CheY-like chemotaxis protein